MKRLRDQRGAALVEFAFVFPILMVVVLGTLSMIWLLTARSALSGAARDGARFASIRHDPICDQPSCPTDWPSEDEVTAFVRERAGGFAVDDVDLVRPTQANEEVAVTVHGHLPALFRPVASLFNVGDLEYLTTAKARAE